MEAVQRTETISSRGRRSHGLATGKCIVGNLNEDYYDGTIR